MSELSLVSKVFIAIVSILHFYFFILESILWTKPKGLKVFNMDIEQAMKTKILALNQGWYNLFFSVGLLWSLISTDPIIANTLAKYILTSIFVAGIVGGMTVTKRIFIIQSIPALVGLFFVFWK